MQYNKKTTAMRSQLMNNKQETKEITDKAGTNLFSLLFWSNRALEEIQAASGEVREFKNEWQFHYTALVGKVLIDNTLLYIGFPLVAYNYPQQVSYGSVHFHLDDVSAANEKAIKKSHKKIKELYKSKTFQFISHLFEHVEWNLVGFNTIHAHPGEGLTFRKVKENESVLAIGSDGEYRYSHTGISNFSTVDLRKDSSNPGVVYPLQDGQNIPSFSGILQHGDKLAELIHSEYRLFSSSDDKLNYLRGQNVTIVGGRQFFPAPTVQPTPIHELFGIEPDQEPSEKAKYSYVLLDLKDKSAGLKTDLFRFLLEKWDNEYFPVDYSLIDPDNITTSIVTSTTHHTPYELQGRKVTYRGNHSKSLFADMGEPQPMSPFERFTLSATNELLGTFSDEELVSLFEFMGNIGAPLLSFSNMHFSGKILVFVNTFNAEPASMKRVIVVRMLRILLEVDDYLEDMSDAAIIQMFNEYYQ